jgi:hypothetical protein
MWHSQLEFFITDATFHIDSEEKVFSSADRLTASFWASKFEKFKNPIIDLKNRPKLAIGGSNDKNYFLFKFIFKKIKVDFFLSAV